MTVWLHHAVAGASACWCDRRGVSRPCHPISSVADQYKLTCSNREPPTHTHLTHIHRAAQAPSKADRTSSKQCEEELRGIIAQQAADLETARQEGIMRSKRARELMAEKDKEIGACERGYSMHARAWHSGPTTGECAKAGGALVGGRPSSGRLSLCFVRCLVPCRTHPGLAPPPPRLQLPFTAVWM